MCASLNLAAPSQRKAPGVHNHTAGGFWGGLYGFVEGKLISDLQAYSISRMKLYISGKTSLASEKPNCFVIDNISQSHQLR